MPARGRFSYVDLEQEVSEKDPLRVIKAVVDDVLVSRDGEFERHYEGTGRQLMEQISFNLLFRWCVGLGIDDAVWDHSTFSKNRDRPLDAKVAAKFLEAELNHAKVKRFLSYDHFSVDGMLVTAC